jgi:hypothetical protein
MANNWLEKEKWEVFCEFPSLLMGKNSIREVAEEGQEQFDRLRKIQSEITSDIQDGTLIFNTREPTPIEILDHRGGFAKDEVYEVKPDTAIKWAKEKGFKIDFDFLNKPFSVSKQEKESTFDEKACLNIIGTFLEILLKDDNSKKNFKSQNDLIGYITDTLRYDFYGLSERNLKGVFSAANKSIKEEKTK